ncbi:MAG: transposase family protein [Gemmataceae bacterium]
MSEQDRLEFWTKALDLPDFRVVHERRDTPSDPVLFTVVPVRQIAPCPHCSCACDVVHRRLESGNVKDLPIGEQRVNLIVRIPQFHCQQCDRFFTPDYPAFAPGAHATQRFLAQAAKLIRFSDIQNAAAFFGVKESTLARWYYDYVERQQTNPPPDLLPITSIGIDELSLKKNTGSTSA